MLAQNINMMEHNIFNKNWNDVFSNRILNIEMRMSF